MMLIGATISHYHIIELLGAGGMGEVYKAEDTRLKRTVALKFLPLGLSTDPEAKERLVHEARAVSALDHPNICTIYEIDETADGRLFLAMAYYEGETLKQRIARGPLSIEEATSLIAQVTRATVAAHEAGIIHRDIKPANILLSRRSDVKLLDFGLAKQPGQTVLTRTGTTVGTVAYMAPEQIAGQTVDERADVWSLGVVLYEMLAGRRPFAGDNDIALLRAIREEQPVPIGRLRSDAPVALTQTVAKALQKEPKARCASARELLQQVEAVLSSTVGRSDGAVQKRPKPNRRLLVGVAAALLLAVAAGGWFFHNQARSRSASRMLEQISGLVEQERYTQAFMLLHRGQASLTSDAALAKVRDSFLWPITIETMPPGADLYVKPYDDVESEWQYLGRSPLATHGCFCYFRWRVSKPGFSPFEGAVGSSTPLFFTLAAEGTVPDGMVRVPPGTISIPTGGSVRLAEFFIDRYEVTNREFKRFIDAGGYRSREYWTEPFDKDGRTLTWDEAIVEFRDGTGRPGPSTWELGMYPEGQADYPVGGVSWHEAAAFARFAGKMLPTVYHWQRASGINNIYSEVLELSNFTGKGPSPVGDFKGMGPFGMYDMAGNLKEWCWNAVDDRRYILGGGWNEPNYQFQAPDARLPFDRSSTNGIRTIKLADSEPLVERANQPVDLRARDYTRDKPVANDVFRAYVSLYSYDNTDLKASVEAGDETSPTWRVERVSFEAAYGNERIPAYLFLPKNAAPPYQTVVYFPHGSSAALRSFEQAEMSYLGFLVKAGRALLLPMYKGTYERRLAKPVGGPNAQRDLTIQQVKDVSRAVDYLRTRSDLDHSRIAFFGVSLGASLGSIALAVERRFNAAVLWSGGLRLDRSVLPEVDPANYAPHVTIPVLMLNGREDFLFPIETSQLPMFQLLGTKAEDKKRVLYDGGHVFPFARLQKDTLDWLDKYLGVPR
jgi:serine/threonine protein kinase/dienelactone hydrolase